MKTQPGEVRIGIPASLTSVRVPPLLRRPVWTVYVESEPFDPDKVPVGELAEMVAADAEPEFGSVWTSQYGPYTRRQEVTNGS